MTVARANICDVPGRVELMGVAFDALTERSCIDRILASLDAGEGGMVVTANLDHLRRCVRDPAYRELVSEADLVVADGMPLIWASRLRGRPLPERVAGSTMSLTLAESAAGRGRSIFLLGGDPGVAERAGEALERRFAGTRIAGVHCPPMGFENDPEQVRAIEQALAGSGADIVYVALGSPKQERLIRSMRTTLPGAWWIGVGISLSFITGDVRRAPRWVQRIGLEWAHRLIQEPRRLFRRYLIEGAPFAIRLLGGSVAERFGVRKQTGSGRERVGGLGASAEDAGA